MNSSDVATDILSLSKAGTMQLRTIARVIHVKYYSRLKRGELILAIIAKKEELWNKQQQDLWSDETGSVRKRYHKDVMKQEG